MNGLSLKHCVLLSLILPMAACSSGGGGGTPLQSTTTGTSASPTSTVLIGGPSGFALVGDLPSATAAAPNFTTSFPADGTVFPLLQTELNLSSTTANGVQTNTVNGASEGAQGVSLTITGTQVVNGQTQAILELQIPARNVDATGLTGNGSTVTLPDGRQLVLATASLNYSLYAAWGLTPLTAGVSGTGQFGVGISGYQTPLTAVPTGSATYVGSGTSGGATGVALVGTSAGTVGAGSIQGQANIGVNFSTGAVTGSLTNMTITPASGGTAAPWNNVSLTGSLAGTSIAGLTASSGTPPSGPMSFDASSTGQFSGDLFGPNGQELGAVWTLHDPTGQGKAAIGFIGAVKQ